MITMSEFDKNSENIDEDDDLEYLINLYGREDFPAVFGRKD